MSDMEADMRTETMWTLSEDRETVRLQVPPLMLDGWPKPSRNSRL